MSATSSASLRKRVTPGGWVAIAWFAGVLFTCLLRLRLPGQDRADVIVGELFLRWDGITMLVLASALALGGSALLSRRPTTALGLLLGAAVVAATPLGVTGIPYAQYLAVDVALHAIAVARPPREAARALLVSLGVLVGYLAVRLLAGWSVGITNALGVALAAVVAWLLGRSERLSRQYAERSRAQAAEQAVIAERLRIAREMHDTVAHSIGIVALQAGAARRVITTQPESARQALGEIETASRETLAGLRRLLGALRTAEGAGEGTTAAGGRPPGAPATAQPSETRGLPEMPGLAALDRLAEVTGAAGVRVTVRRVGTPRPLPPEIDLSAFRLVQESVTNVVRHSGADSCTVTVDHRDPEAVAVTIENPGSGHIPGRDRDHPGGGSGYGLVGMRERVALLRGDFRAGPRPDGGYGVTARLPVPSLPAGASTR
ncbi:sensor histidine kinase [Streptomyces sp. NPDC056144]|uniref:sensor histidine kinase n=1 Tax=unclassified Streptomyces TaxID=2593676 RepID=UPI0035E0425C